MNKIFKSFTIYKSVGNISLTVSIIIIENIKIKILFMLTDVAYIYINDVFSATINNL